jgi:Fe-S cluster assembly ATP-binding protein
MLSIKGLCVTVDGKKILKGMNLEVPAGEVHAIMGPNGAGKSTLGAVIAGKPGYEVTAGSIHINGESILEKLPEERAHAGVFLGFQYPVEIPGVNNAYFLRTALNNKRQQQGLDELDAVDFMQLIKEKMSLLSMDPAFLKRSLNQGFSGGEKKRNEILQMMLLDPCCAVLDETDSGLDIDALQIVASGINHMRDPARAFLLVTHYQRLLDYVEPDRVHVLVDGQIIRSGGKGLALELERDGYTNLVSESKHA